MKNHPPLAGLDPAHLLGQGLAEDTLMEFVDGVNLAQLMKTDRVSPREALAIVPQICDAPHYMAPEQIEHPSDVDHRADIYALGVVFYQMLTGELPDVDLQAPSRKVSIDVRLDEIVLKALQRKPEQRYQQASVMKTRVEGLRNPANVQAHPQSSHQTDEPAHDATSVARTDPFAITSFILGISSLILWPLGALPAIVFGHVSRGRIRKNRSFSGDGFAIAGLTLGYLFLIASVALAMASVLLYENLENTNDAHRAARDAQIRAVAEAGRIEAADADTQSDGPSLSEVEIIGAVHNRGRLRVPIESSLLDALAAAGGWTPNGDLWEIRIRMPGADEAAIHDLNAILRGDAVNPLIVPGSVIEIPEK